MQIPLKTKTSYLYFIKKLFNFLVNKAVIFFSFILLSCSTHLIQAEEITPNDLVCAVSHESHLLLIKNSQFFSAYNDQNFENLLLKINKKFEKNSFNLLVTSGSKPSAGYSLKFDKMIKKKEIIQFYFEDVKPPVASLNAAINIFPYCLLNISNLNKFKIFIDNDEIKKK